MLRIKGLTLCENPERRAMPCQASPQRVSTPPPALCLCRSSQEEAFFLAQLFFAIAAPLFFSRVLFLAQIDENLGLMVQVRLSSVV